MDIAVLVTSLVLLNLLKEAFIWWQCTNQTVDERSQRVRFN